MNQRCSKVGRKGQRAFTTQLQSAHTALKRFDLLDSFYSTELCCCFLLLWSTTCSYRTLLQRLLGSLGFTSVGSTSAQTSAQTRQTCCSVPGSRVCLMGFVLGGGLGGTLWTPCLIYLGFHGNSFTNNHFAAFDFVKNLSCSTA